MLIILKKFFFLIILSFLLTSKGSAQIINKIEIFGNERISNETIILFSKVKLNQNLEQNDLNKVLKNLYETDFFKNVSVKIENDSLIINVQEEAIIQNIEFNGIKNKTTKQEVTENLLLKERASFNEISLQKDRSKMINSLRNYGYYFSKVNISIENLEDNKVNIIYDIDLGSKAKIAKIKFTGDKIFKDRKLRNIIISEEYKFWKFISGKKFLNEDFIKLDLRLLKQFYLNRGYYNVQINSSFAKLVSDDSFELVFNINANEKIFFNDLRLNLPQDYEKQNFDKIYKFFSKLKGEIYSVNKIDQILKKIDEIVIAEQFESIKATVEEKIFDNKIDLTFNVEETEKFFIERINIFGNNITEENVIRNQLIVDEGDPLNEILYSKSINRIKSLNFFKTVEAEIIDAEDNNKIINIKVEEKPTGEIVAGYGFGTSGSTLSAAVKENNYLGRGISVNSKLSLSEESLKGIFSVSNPNYRNSDKSIFSSLQALTTDRLESSGYKTSKSGFTFGTRFEYLDDFNLGLSTTNYYEKISTNSTASTRQKAQEGNYWDSFLVLDFILDKRNQRFQTTSGYLSAYTIDLPVISDTNSFINSYKYKVWKELYNENVTSFSFTAKSAFSLKREDIKLSERLFTSEDNLRGFEVGKVGPKDGSDFVGGNYLTAFNVSTTLPQVMPSLQNSDFFLFLDVANIWGVDYDSSIDDTNTIRSSVGLGVDWFTPIGPMNFSFSQPISKEDSDVTESFRFNIGTSF